MRAGDESFEQLRSALEELAGNDAAQLLDDARAEARVRVRSMLSDALAHAMLERVNDQLTPPAEPRPREPRPPVRSASVPPPEPPPPQPSPPEAELAWYVYGVVAAADPPQTGGIAGIEEQHPVTVVVEGGLGAVVSRVSLDEFDEATLREHLGDMAWVEATARSHDGVLDAMRQAATVIPMRMCTIYRSEDALRTLLRRESATLTDALARLRAKTEWGVKVFCHSGGHQASEPASHEDRPGHSAPSGAAYMESLRHERDSAERDARLIDDTARDIHERLCAHAAEGVLLALQREEVSGHRGRMVLNGAYLVQDDLTEAFHQEVRRLQDVVGSTGLELLQTGPWPAYNFLPGAIGVAW